MDLGISGKKAIVCASSNGLGLGCAIALADAGVDLTICARTEYQLTVAKNIIELWLTTDYEAGRHDIRLNKLKQIENINFAE